MRIQGSPKGDPMLRPLSCLVGAVILAQDPPPSPWVPQGEVTLRWDRIGEPDPSKTLVVRQGIRLRLGWEVEEGAWSARAGLWAALGSDGNRLNIPRYDQQPSNGLRLDSGWVQVQSTGNAAFASLRLGHQENPLLAQESLWDKDLRVTGASGRLAWRSEHIPELGIRAVAGRVRTLLDGRVTLAAVQAVFRIDTGPLSWAFHGDRWDLRFDPSLNREVAVPGLGDRTRQRLAQDVVGASVVWHTTLPVELKTLRHRDPVSHEDGAETQVWFGSRTRSWWPQVGYIWQRFDRRGTFYPVNGDDWWFMWNARGPRYEVALPLPGQWLVVASYIRHRSYNPKYPLVDRGLLQVVKKF